MQRRLILAAAAALSALVVAEISLRVFIGERPLLRPHPTIEYENAPGQRVVYRGRLHQTNALGLRSAEIAPDKPDDVIRVAVFGDSIVFGHTDTDQADLATTHLSATQAPDGRRIEALNIAANSWGPGNMLAWLEAHRDLQLDAGVVVLSTHDLTDDRTFEPIAAQSLAQSRMPLAILTEVARLLSPPVAIEGAPATPPKDDARNSLPSLFGYLSALPGGSCLILHETIEERAQPSSPTANELVETARAYGASVVAGRDFVGPADYSDDIHLNAQGQRNLARAVRACLDLTGATAPILPTP